MEILRNVIKHDGSDDSKKYLNIQMNLCNLTFLISVDYNNDRHSFHTWMEYQIYLKLETASQENTCLLYIQGMLFYPGSSCSSVSVKFYWRTSCSQLVIHWGINNLHSRLAIVVHWPQLSPRGNCLTQCKYLVCSPYSWVILYFCT